MNNKNININSIASTGRINNIEDLMKSISSTDKNTPVITPIFQTQKLKDFIEKKKIEETNNSNSILANGSTGKIFPVGNPVIDPKTNKVVYYNPDNDCIMVPDEKKNKWIKNNVEISLLSLIDDPAEQLYQYFYFYADQRVWITHKNGLYQENTFDKTKNYSDLLKDIQPIIKDFDQKLYQFYGIDPDVDFNNYVLNNNRVIAQHYREKTVKEIFQWITEFKDFMDETNKVFEPYFTSTMFNDAIYQLTNTISNNVFIKHGNILLHKNMYVLYRDVMVFVLGSAKFQSLTSKDFRGKIVPDQIK